MLLSSLNFFVVNRSILRILFVKTKRRWIFHELVNLVLCFGSTTKSSPHLKRCSSLHRYYERVDSHHFTVAPYLRLYAMESGLSHGLQHPWLPWPESEKCFIFLGSERQSFSFIHFRDSIWSVLIPFILTENSSSLSSPQLRWLHGHRVIIRRDDKLFT